jgi:hypothetical protein
MSTAESIVCSLVMSEGTAYTAHVNDSDTSYRDPGIDRQNSSLGPVRRFIENNLKSHGGSRHISTSQWYSNGTARFSNKFLLCLV